MQTFLPYPSFSDSVKCLDYRRLGKQRVEAWMIIEILRGKESRWKNHPAVLMWEGYELALTRYYNLCIWEWAERGYKNEKLSIIDVSASPDPWWIGMGEFHISHQSNLLRKFPEYYTQYFSKDVPNSLPYWWPTQHLEMKDDCDQRQRIDRFCEENHR
jgi:hypothetical protein